MSGFAGTNEEKASQSAAKVKADVLPQHEPPAPKPAEQKAHAGGAVTKLEHVAEVAEAEAAKLSDGRLDHVLAPDAVLAASAKTIAAAFRGVKDALDAESPPPASIAAAIERLDAAIGTLYVLGRRHHVRMRESGLEQVFDLEDGVRAQHSLNGMSKRADTYYDDEAATTHAGDATPDAASLAKEVKSETAPRNGSRAATLLKAQQLGEDMCSALSAGLGLAEGIIKEPDQPVEKSLIERLADFAAKMVLKVAEVGVGQLLGAGLGGATSALGIEEHLGQKVSEIFIDGFKDGGVDVAKEALGDTHGAQPGEPHSEHGEGGEEATSKVKPKKAYLDAATKRTMLAEASMRNRFAARASTFPRLPTETLNALVEGFHADSIMDEYTKLVVREWVNFGKRAAAEGIEMRDREKLKQQGPATRVDNVLDPYGVLRIGVRLSSDSKPQLERARIGGVSNEVLSNLRLNKNLGEIGIHRRIELVAEDSKFSGEGFEVDPYGVVLGQPAHLSEAGRRTFAQIAGHMLGDSVSDGDVYAGMFALTSWLRTIPCAKIQADGE